MANTAFITSSASAPKGVMFVAPVGTTMPKSAVEELDPAFQDMGTISDAGVTIALVEGETSNIKITHPHDLVLAELILKNRS